jgi:two-component system sensor histidine kinase UhpB
MIGLLAIMIISQKNIRDEILSTQSLAVFAIENGIQKNPEFYLFQKDDDTFGLSELTELRHLQIQFINSNGRIIDGTRGDLNNISQPPLWFQNILGKFSSSIPSKKIEILQRGKIIGNILIKPEPIYEYSEIWEQVNLGLWIMITFFSFVNLIIFILFSHMIKPIKKIIEGFEKLEEGNYKARVSRSNILELNMIGRKFNSMVGKLKNSNYKIHKLSQDLINVQEQEKKELARNLHDELGQVLTAIQAEAASIPNSRSKKSQNLAAESIIGLSKNIMLSTREIIKNLSLGLLDELGFEDAIKDLIDSWQKRYKHINVSRKIDGHILEVIKAEKQPHIYRIIQEALTNIAKHSKAKKISIKIFYPKQKNKIKIVIENDGFNLNDIKAEGTGLMGIRERVNQIKGKININKGKLFKIIIELNIKE